MFIRKSQRFCLDITFVTTIALAEFGKIIIFVKLGSVVSTLRNNLKWMQDVFYVVC